MTSAVAARWCFTKNNPTQSDEDDLSGLVPGSARYVLIGRERAPTTGTRHLQGYLVLSSPQRRSYFRRTLGLVGFHWEIARGTTAQNVAYCTKDGDYDEFGTRPSDLTPPKPGFVDGLVHWITEWITNNGRAPTRRELATHQPKAFLLYNRKLEELCQSLAPEPKLEEGTPTQWQSDLESILDGEPDDRLVLFYVDKEGAKGKTWFQKYYYTKHPDRVQLLGVAKRDDLAHAIDPTKSCFLINVPRGGSEYLQYTILEQLKDRMVFSPKYDSKMKVLTKNVHVVVFMNEDPLMDKMSEDRYDIYEF